MLPVLVSFVLLATFTHGANVGEQCSTVLECPANADCIFDYSTCSTGICECNAGFRATGDQSACAAEMYIDDEDNCASNADCEVSLVEAMCDTGNTDKCVCNTGLSNQYPAEADQQPGDTVYCYQLAYGEDCSNAQTAETCLTVISGNGACLDSGDGFKCSCAEGYRRDEPDGQLCLPFQYNEECTEDSICDGTLECLPDGEETPVDRCLCPGELIWQNEFCVAADAPTDLSVGQPCTLTPNEEPDVGFCADGLEMCAVCQTEEDDTARCQATRGTIAIDEACELESSMCASGMAVCTDVYEDCSSGFCQCPDGHFLFDEDCHPDLYCQETADCDLQFGDLSVSTCVTENLRCECATEGEMLLKNHDEQHCGIPADGECARNEDNEQIPDNCLAFKINGAAACVSGGFMQPDVCGCADRYEMVDEVCVPVVLDYMAGCLDQEDRCIGNTVCVEDTNDENTLKCMCEGRNIHWDEDYQMCIHGGAATDLTDDDECNTNYESSGGLLCSPWLVCDVCPGEGGNTFCQRGIGVEDPIDDPPTTPPSEPDTEEPDPTEPNPTEPNPTEPNPTEPDGTEPADPNEPDPTEGDGAVHMHVSALLLVVAGLVACIQL